MTPAQHEALAESMLIDYEAGDVGRQYVIDRALAIQVHAELAQTLGTGSHYVSSEAALAQAVATSIDYSESRYLRAALLHAVLADR